MVLVITSIEQRKDKQEEKSRILQCIILLSPNNQALRLTNLRWIKSLLYYENGQEEYSIVNDLYQATVISVLAVGYSMLGKKILKVSPQSTQKFDLEDMGKLVAIVAASR